MKKFLIYHDDDFQIYKKGDPDFGTYPPADMLHIISIGIDGLSEWKNAGLKYKRDLEQILGGFVGKFKKMLDSFEEKNEK